VTHRSVFQEGPVKTFIYTIHWFQSMFTLYRIGFCFVHETLRPKCKQSPAPPFRACYSTQAMFIFYQKQKYCRRHLKGWASIPVNKVHISVCYTRSWITNRTKNYYDWSHHNESIEKPIRHNTHHLEKRSTVLAHMQALSGMIFAWLYACKLSDYSDTM
jgi:hypothetical protein